METSNRRPVFRKTARDGDYAPVTAALTPAFSSDSTPEIVSSAVQICSAAVGCVVVKDVARMGGILKLLTSALRNDKGQLNLKVVSRHYHITECLHISDCRTFNIGDVGEIHSNASGVLQVSAQSLGSTSQVASSWAQWLDPTEPHQLLSGFRHSRLRQHSWRLWDASRFYFSHDGSILLRYEARGWQKPPAWYFGNSLVTNLL